MASSPALPEPMNSSPHHSKVKVSITLPDPTFLAGTHVSGKFEMECRADRGLGIGIMMVELFAVQELTSRDHSATSTFLHSRRLFQGPSLPPSNAVQAHPMPGDPPLPQHYHQARKGKSTFLFRVPVPETCPNAISFGAGLAKVVYELRASVGVFWKDEKRLVVDRRRVDVVQAYPYHHLVMSGMGMGLGLGNGNGPEAIVVGENGKLWMQGKVVPDVIVAGDSACLELQVKNHSSKKNTALTLSLVRTLYLSSSSSTNPHHHHQPQSQSPLQITDTLTTVPYRGPEYIIPPGAEGVANLVFDVPAHARGVRGGMLDGEEIEETDDGLGLGLGLAGGRERGQGRGRGPRRTEALFEVRCKVEVKLSMGMGSKDIILEIPVEVVHPIALPSQPQPPHPFPFPSHSPHPPPFSYPIPVTGAGPYPLLPYTTPQAQAQAQDGLYTDYSHNPNPYYPDAGAGAGGLHPTALSLSPPPPPGLAHHIPYLDTVQNQVWMPPPLPIPIPMSPVSHDQGQGQGQGQGYFYHPYPQLHAYPYPYPHANVNVNAIGDPTEGYFSPSSPHPHPQIQPVAGGQQQEENHHQQENQQEREQEQKRRYPRSLPAPPPPLLLNNGTGTGTAMGAGSGNGNGPGVITATATATSTTSATGIVHSPRPQLTPKHSLTFAREVISANNHNNNNINNHTSNANGNGSFDITTTRTKSKSERVEELEKMADEVEKRSRDLSCDLPRGMSDILGMENLNDDEETKVNVNKTLPGPPVPSGKNLLLPPGRGRARADLYFSEADHVHPETTPLPSDQTPPTPALLAVHPSRSSRLHTHTQQRGRHQHQHQQEQEQDQRQQQQNRNDLRTESGLDALERRLLAEVGTRKRMDVDVDMDKAREKEKEKDKRPDVRDVLSVLEDGASRTERTRTSSASVSVSMSIPATTKSPETLHDSAISSLTLAGGMGGDEVEVELEQEQELEQEFDGRTHRAGKSRAGSAGDEEDEEEDDNDKGRLTNGGGGGVGGVAAFAAASGSGLHFHMRERAQAVSTPTKTLNLERVRSGGVGGGVGGGGSGGQRDQDSREDVDSGKSREGKSSGKKKDRSGKSAAKGRVAAWLGGIDPDVPPQEQIIPPSPSVCQTPASPFAVGQDDRGHDTQVETEGLPVFAEPAEVISEVSAPPNPRSSGFVPIATLKKETLAALPMIARDATVVEEARRVQDIWASSNEDTPIISAQEIPRFFKALQPAAAGPMSIHTNRRVSPPSAKPPAPPPPDPQSKPLSYSAVAKNVWKSPDVAVKPVVLPPAPPPKSPISPLPKRFIQSQTQQVVGRAPIFPPPKPIDPEVKYDIRSARGGRGGKVTAVANLWASGAINNANSEQGKGKGVSRPVIGAATPPQPHPPSAPSPPPLPPRTGKKLFSDAVLTPALPPKRTPTAMAAVSGKPNAVSRPAYAQKRPDARTAFFSPPNTKSTSTPTVTIPSDPKPPSPLVGAPTIHTVHPVPKKVQSATSLVPLPHTPTAGNKLGAVEKGSKSTEALVLLQKRPATAMSSSSPWRPHGKTTPTSLSTPSSSQAADPNPNLKPDPNRHQKLPAVHNLVANLNLNLNLKARGGGNVNVNKSNNKPKPKPVMPVYKGTSDPAVVSSSHAVPMLSSTASLARPHTPSSSSSGGGGGGGGGVLSSSAPLKLPLNDMNLVPPRISSGLGLGLGLSVDLQNGHVANANTNAFDGQAGAGATPGRPLLVRPTSPSPSPLTTKPVNVVPDLAIGQARIRDLIKKYQGQTGAAGAGAQVGQRT